MSRRRKYVQLTFIAGLAAAGLIFACDERGKGPPPPPSASPPSPASVAATLGLDASMLEAVDPPPPAGDLKAEIDGFVNLDTCVRDRAKMDPLVGDALRAIGYDTFLRDACRLLEAAKDKKPETCDRIDSSALKSRCRAWVAMVAQTPDACPLLYEALPARGRSPTCIAVAGKDPRLCQGEARTAARATCEALSTRDDTKCDVLLPTDRPGCKREVARWRSLLAAPLDGLPKLVTPRGKLVARGADGTADPPAPENDVTPDVSRGAVVVTLRDRARVEIGLVGDADALRIAPGPNKRARIGAAIVLEPAAFASKDGPKPVLDRLEIDLPGDAPIAYPGGRCDCKVTTARVDKTRGGEVSFGIKGKAGSGAKTYEIDVEIVTFVRDVVAEQPGSRALPPVHPAIGIGALGASPSSRGPFDAGR